MNYEWDPGIDHDWLSVDEEGHVAVFSSNIASALPSDINLPWPLLHNLRISVVAWLLGLKVTDDAVSSMKFEDEIDLLSRMGFYVFDANQKPTAEMQFSCLRCPRVESTPCLPTWFVSVAKCFVADGVSFGKCVDGAVMHFSRRIDADPGYVSMPLEERIALGASLAEDLLRRKGASPFDLPDVCAPVGAPPGIGNTFSSWDSVRPLYLSLVRRLWEALGAQTLRTLDVWGRRTETKSPDEFCDALQNEPLPCKELVFLRDGAERAAIVLPWWGLNCLSQALDGGFIPRGWTGARVEWWRFEWFGGGRPYGWADRVMRYWIG